MNVPNLTWLANTVFFGSYFIAWLVHAFDPLTSVSSAAHTFIVLTAISAAVLALASLLYGGLPYVRHQAAPEA